MKKLLLALVIVAGTFFCNAQVFIGGNIGYGLQTGKTESQIGTQTTSENSPKVSTFEINPFVGYMFNKSVGIGLDFGYGLSTTKSEFEQLNEIVKIKSNSSAWTVAPFFRWVFGNFERVKLYADTKVSFKGINSTAKATNGNNTETVKGPKEFDWGIAIVPGIKFMLNNHISMNGKINLLSLGYASSKVTKETGDGSKVAKEVEKTNTFGIGLNEKTAITLGFVYTF